MKQKNLNKANAGFTLVELIVVIAIMAILAGVGTVGYGAYIKQANKKADMTTVGNILRAIDTGSYAYKIDDRLQLEGADLTIPVGFITLTKDENAKALESTSTIGSTSAYHNKDGKLPDNTYVCSDIKEGKITFKYGDLSTSFGNPVKYMEGSDRPEGWCTVCTQKNLNNLSAEIEKVYTHDTIITVNNPKDFLNAAIKIGELLHDAANFSQVTYYKMNEDLKKSTFVYHTDDDMLGEVATTTPGYIQNETGITTKTDGVLNDVLVAAYGENYNITLKSDEWKSTEISSFYLGSAKLWDTVKTLSNTAAYLSKTNIDAINGAFSKEYENGESMIKAFANTVVGTDASTSKNTFVTAWTSAYGNNNAIGYSFGLSGRENYTAARTAYNSCVASYIDSQNVTHYKDIKSQTLANGDEESHATAIRNFSETVAGVNLGLPKLVCNEAFDSSYTDTKLPTDVQECETCKNLYKQYHEVGMDKVDAEAFFDTMTTIQKTGTAASESALGFWDYYDTYLKEFDTVYTAVATETANKSAIVIVITYKDGLLHYEVSPSTANPRS